MSTHIKSNKGDIAPLVIMSGDPLRVKYIAEKYLEDYKLVNEVRNIYAYTGNYKGKRITVMAHGMGIPSCGIYTYELFNDYDVESIIRLGTAGSYSKDLNINDIVLVTESYSDSVYAYDLNGYTQRNIKSNEEINTVIGEISSKEGIIIKRAKVYSTDNFYTKNDISKIMNEKYGCDAVEMESFALFYNAKYFNRKASCLLTISDSFITHEELSSEERERKLDEMIELGLESIIKL